MNRTDKQIVEVGTFAKGLLESTTFNELHKEYTDAMLSTIVSSQPHELKLREFEYAKLQAIAGFVQHLVGLAVAAENIINKTDKPTDEAETGYDVED